MKTKLFLACAFFFNILCLNAQYNSGYNPANINISAIRDENNLLKDYCTSIEISHTIRLDLFSPKMFRIRESKFNGEMFPDVYQIPFAMGKYEKWTKIEYQKTEDEIFIYISTDDIQIRFFKVNYTWLVWDKAGKKQLYPSNGHVYGMCKDGYALFDAASYHNEENIYSRYSHHFYNPDTKRYDIVLKDNLLMDTYFIYGPDYASIFQQYNDLVGAEPMLPKKAFGFFQTQHLGCDGNQQKLFEVIENYKKLQIPIDNIILDYEWGDGCNGSKNIKWGSQMDWSSSYNSPLSVKQFLDSLKRLELNVMTIRHNVPEVPGDPKLSWTMYRFPWEEWWPNFLKSIDLGVAGTWQDTRANDLADHFIYSGLQDFTRKRPYFLANYDVFENSGWAKFKYYLPATNCIGTRRTPFHWTGDAAYSWEEFMFQVNSVTNTHGSMKGISYLSTDVNCDNWKLAARWNQFNDFSGISRTHTRKPWSPTSNKDAGLFAFGDAAKNLNTDLVVLNQTETKEEIETLIGSIKKHRDLRYQLLPYIYSTAYENYKTGMPICRPMLLGFPNDSLCNKNQFAYQYMFGPSFLVAPSFNPKEKTVRVYLPSGCKWIDYWNKTVYNGGDTIYPNSQQIDQLTLFVRSGAIIPMQSKRLRIDSTPEDSLFFEVYPDGKSSFEMYDDDGVTIAYQKGQFGKTEISCNDSQDKTEINISALTGDFNGKPEKRTYTFDVFLQDNLPSQVLIDNKKIKQTVSLSHLINSTWYYDAANKKIIFRKVVSTNKALNIRILK